MQVLQIDINKDYRDAIAEAVAVLRAGGTVVYPTDTLYAIGANALNRDAVKKVFAIKQREGSQPVPILVKNMIWAKELVHVSPKVEKIVASLWPGPWTAILSKRITIHNRLSMDLSSVGVRIADHALADYLLGKFGYPLTATAANISGQIPSQNCSEVISAFRNSTLQPDLVLDIGTLPPASPSTVIDFTSDRPKIVRVGATTPEELLKLLEIE